MKDQQNRKSAFLISRVTFKEKFNAEKLARIMKLNVSEFVRKAVKSFIKENEDNNKG